MNWPRSKQSKQNFEVLCRHCRLILPFPVESFRFPPHLSLERALWRPSTERGLQGIQKSSSLYISSLKSIGLSMGSILGGEVENQTDAPLETLARPHWGQITLKMHNCEVLANMASTVYGRVSSQSQKILECDGCRHPHI